MPNPTVSWTIAQLKKYHGDIPKKPILDPVDELVQTVLSQNTSDINSSRAYESLKSTFPSWDPMLKADDGQVANAIRAGGLADIKAPRLKAMLSEIKKRRGKLDLTFLKALPPPQAKEWLQQLPGVGPKTAACVLLFSLGMPALPVDTHVLRVAQRLGLVPGKASAGEAQERLEAQVPLVDIYAFHLLLIQHGRTVCKARLPACGECVLNLRCPAAFTFRKMN